MIGIAWVSVMYALEIIELNSIKKRVWGTIAGEGG